MQQRPLTQKQETFVRKVAEGMAASRAYKEAGYMATAHAAEVMASKTLRNAEVAARLAELRAEQAKRHEVTIDSLAREFDENRAHALRVDQVGAAVQATAMKAKLFGFMVDRQQVQVEHTLRKPSADENAPAEMSLEDYPPTPSELIHLRMPALTKARHLPRVTRAFDQDDAAELL